MAKKPNYDDWDFSKMGKKDLGQRKKIKQKGKLPFPNFEITACYHNDVTDCDSNGSMLLNLSTYQTPQGNSGMCNNPTITYNLTDSSGNFIVQDSSFYVNPWPIPGWNAVITGGPSAYTLTCGINLAGTFVFPYGNLPPDTYTFTILATECSGAAGTNLPLTCSETIVIPPLSTCKYWPELTVCNTTNDPVILGTLMGTGGYTYATYFSMFGQVGQLMNNSCVHMPYVMHYIFPSAAPPVQWYIDGVPLSSADIGKSFDLATFDPNLIGASLYPIIPGAMFLTITDVCAPAAYQSVTTPILYVTSSPCGVCDLAAWNSIPYSYLTTWYHLPSMFYNPPIVLPGWWGLPSPSNGGTGIPTGAPMFNPTANIDYANQSTICEWCDDWIQNGSIPGTFDNRVLAWGISLLDAEGFCVTRRWYNF